MQVLEGAINATSPDVREFIATYKPTFPVGIVDTRFAMNYAQVTPGMRPTVPIVFFIDPKGVIQAQYFGTDPFFQPESQMAARFREQINKLLPKAPSSKKKSAPRGKK